MTDLIASGAESSEFNVLAEVPIGELIIGTVAFLIVFSSWANSFFRRSQGFGRARAGHRRRAQEGGRS